MTTTHPATHPPETHIPASQHKLVVDVPPASAELLPATGCHVPARTPRKHPITRTHSGDSPSRWGWGWGGWRGAAGGDTEGEPTRPTATLPTLSVRLHHRSHEMPPPPPNPQHTHPHPTSLPPTHPPKCDTVSGTLGTQTGPCAATVPVCQNNSAVCKTVSLRFHSRLKQVAVGHWRGCVNPRKQVCGSLASSETLLPPTPPP